MSTMFVSYSLAEMLGLGVPLFWGLQPRAGWWLCQGWSRPPTDRLQRRHSKLPWVSPSCALQSRYSWGRKLSLLWHEFVFLPCCPILVQSILTIVAQIWCFSQHPAVQYMLFFCMIPSVGCSSRLSNIGREDGCMGRALGVLPGEEQKRHTDREMGICGGCL